VSSSWITLRSRPEEARREAGRIVWWVGGWAALALFVHLVYLFVVLPMIDRALVFFVAGKNGAGGATAIELDSNPTAVISTIAAVLGVGGAVIAVALYRARPTNAHQVAVVALALIAGSLALDAAGLMAVVVEEPITEPGLPGGTPAIVWGVVFLSQLVPLFVGEKGRRRQTS
jgi:hypothetical protein